MADYAIHDTTLTGISNVIRKKDGTSALIDPADYADRINLMGMLEEKTVTGAIASCTDGADSVPIANGNFGITPTLSGVSGMVISHGGKNYLSSASAETKTNNSVSITCDGNGKYTLSGTATGGSANIRFSLSEPSKIASGMYLHFKNNTYTTVSSLTFERADQTQIFSLTPAPADRIYDMSNYVGEEVSYIRFYVANNGLVDYFLTPMFSFENTTTDYSPYEATDTHSVSFGQTIYGGSYNSVSGVLTSTHAIVNLGTLTWTKRNTSSGHWRFTTQDVPVIVNDDNSHVPDMVCDGYTAISPSQSYNGITGVTCNTGISQLMICDETYETASDFTTAISGIYLVYPLAQPTETQIEPTPINSRLGNNNWWADSGDSDVTYRASGTITPVIPTLVTKTITENGTYTAEDDNADGYSEVVVNVPSASKLAIHDGKLNIQTGAITEDSEYCYTDEIPCPTGWIRVDFGETSSGNYIGIELLDNGTHSNYWTGNARFRSIDMSSYYSATKTIRLSFRKTNIQYACLLDYGNGQIYSTLEPNIMEEATQSVLNMNLSNNLNTLENTLEESQMESEYSDNEEVTE